ncbi:MAG: UDP-N-acetylmuramoyl-tripeptide--D-alanyl-D-alanine ligase [Clostridiales bacterium]|nr:UDP-N-acetylmuramoyl-tripeptide--D-alanyl-D-alanine ligase [Clostridiales bacterium]
MKMALGEVRSALCLKGDETTDNIEISGISKNTQTIKGGELFVPLRGARFDGHDFIPKAIEAGAFAVLCDRSDINCSLPVIRVHDTLEAAQRLAEYHLSKLSLRKIGVTGSAGKTTTCRMIHSVLSQEMRTFKTEDDMNGQIGLTFSAFDINDSYEAAVLEMGMSEYGELSRLSKIGKPDIAVINMVGSAHIEFFGTRENIRKAKLEILDGMDENGTVILNADDELLWALKESIPLRTIYYGIENPQADVKGEYLGEIDGTQRLSCGSHVYSVPAKGIHYVQNALAAIAVARELKISKEKINEGLKSFLPANGRQKIYDLLGFTILEDCYNASPEAVCASLGVLSEYRNGRRIALLGDMLELGDYTAEGHEKCGRRAAGCADMLLVYGSNREHYINGALSGGMEENSVKGFDTREEMGEYLISHAKKGDALLFKGSMMTKMGEVLRIFSESIK